MGGGGGRERDLGDGGTFPTMRLSADLDPSLLGVEFTFESLVFGLKGLGTHQVSSIVITSYK